MKKFIITEEEKNRILGMHQDHGYNSLNEQIAAPVITNDPGVDRTKQDQFKNQASTLFNTIMRNNPAEKYTEEMFSNLPALKRKFPNSTVYYTVNGRFFQFPIGDMKGTPTIKGSWKLENNKIKTTPDNKVEVVKKVEDVKKQPAKQALKPAGQSTPNTKESSIGVLYQYEYPNDKKYTYGVKDGKWFGKNLANGKEFDLSTITTTITNLNNKFPNALTQQDTPVDTTPTGTTTTGTTTNTVPTNTVPTNTVPKKLTDMSKIELDMMNQKQTLAFNSAYAKLNTFDKEKVNNTIAGK
jgi:hypothetical protein